MKVEIEVSDLVSKDVVRFSGRSKLEEACKDAVVNWCNIVNATKAGLDVQEEMSRVLGRTKKIPDGQIQLNIVPRTADDGADKKEVVKGAEHP